MLKSESEALKKIEKQDLLSNLAQLKTVCNPRNTETLLSNCNVQLYLSDSNTEKKI